MKVLTIEYNGHDIQVQRVKCRELLVHDRVLIMFQDCYHLADVQRIGKKFVVKVLSTQSVTLVGFETIVGKVVPEQL